MSLTETEDGVRRWIQGKLDILAPGRFICVERKNEGRSVIEKPVDLEIRTTGSVLRTVVAVEVANVNTTQLVNEVCRLYFDSCPLKLLILGDRNTPKNGVEMCQRILCRLYGQDHIDDTPSRVVDYTDGRSIEEAISDLLVL